jgi:hypothetical protein
VEPAGTAGDRREKELCLPRNVVGSRTTVYHERTKEEKITKFGLKKTDFVIFEFFESSRKAVVR